MPANTGPYGHRDIPLTVVGGEAESELQLTDQIYNFCIQCDVAASYSYRFTDADGFVLIDSKDLGMGSIVGPTGGINNLRCQNFRLKLYGASDGAYTIRVYVNS